MVDISFEINGKIVQPDDMTDALDILFLKHIREKTKNKRLFSVNLLPRAWRKTFHHCQGANHRQPEFRGVRMLW
jgi:hypothetical protein